MARILNIETATSLCSVVLSENGLPISVNETMEDKSHSAKLTVFIENILAQEKIKISDLDAISVGMGPGSYTGLRIGVSTAKGLCFGAGIPLIAVSTLKVMAYHVIKSDLSKTEPALSDPEILLCPMLDARRMEVFTCLFDINGNEKEEVSAIIVDEFSYRDLLEKHQIAFFGSGMPKCRELLNHKNAYFINDVFPHASSLAHIAEIKYLHKEFENIAYFEPFYLKDFMATKSKKNIIG